MDAMSITFESDSQHFRMANVFKKLVWLNWTNLVLTDQHGTRGNILKAGNDVTYEYKYIPGY